MSGHEDRKETLSCLPPNATVSATAVTMENLKIFVSLFLLLDIFAVIFGFF